MSPVRSLALLCCLLPLACARPTPATANRPQPGFKGALTYRLDLNEALRRQQLTLAATLHAMFSHPVTVAAVELVERGIWVTPRDSSVRAELQPALIEAMGDAYEVRGTSGKSLLVRRTRHNRKLVVRALIRETTLAVRERLAAVAPGCKVTFKRHLSIQLKRPDQSRDVRQLLGQRGDLSLHLVEPGAAARGTITRFQHRVTGKWVLQRQPALTTSLIDGASLQRGQSSGTTNLTLDLTPAGKERLAEVAAAYGGRKLAVVLDGEVLTAPLLKDPPDDLSAITGKLRGRSSEARLERLSRVLQSALLHGPLPARLREIR